MRGGAIKRLKLRGKSVCQGKAERKTSKRARDDPSDSGKLIICCKLSYQAKKSVVSGGFIGESVPE